MGMMGSDLLRIQYLHYSVIILELLYLPFQLSPHRMKFVFYLLVFTTLFLRSQSQTLSLPDSIYSGKQGKFHMQGIVIDKANHCAYFSFTDKLIKTDLSGKLIGSVTGFIGHLGDLDLGNDGKIYGSLEYIKTTQ
jgi:hypothetical protein